MKAKSPPVAVEGFLSLPIIIEIIAGYLKKAQTNGHFSPVSMTLSSIHSKCSWSGLNSNFKRCSIVLSTHIAKNYMQSGLFHKYIHKAESEIDAFLHPHGNGYIMKYE